MLVVPSATAVPTVDVPLVAPTVTTFRSPLDQLKFVTDPMTWPPPSFATAVKLCVSPFDPYVCGSGLTSMLATTRPTVTEALPDTPPTVAVTVVAPFPAAVAVVAAPPAGATPTTAPPLVSAQVKDVTDATGVPPASYATALNCSVSPLEVNVLDPGVTVT
jgi:hypothetical protein